MNRQSKTSATHPSVKRLALSHLLTLALLMMLFAADASATSPLFECVDSKGNTLFTDSPRQLLVCHALDFSSLRNSPAPSNPAKASSTSSPGQDAEVSVSTTPAPGDPQATAVPIERLGSVLVVSATLNGSKQARLIVDTGASQTIISQRFAMDLGLYSTAHMTHVLLHTASGSVQADAVTMESIRIGGAEVRNSHVLIHDLPELPFAVDGLLGLSYLGAYQVTLDTSRGELHLKSSPDKLSDLAENK